MLKKGAAALTAALVATGAYWGRHGTQPLPAALGKRGDPALLALPHRIGGNLYRESSNRTGTGVVPYHVNASMHANTNSNPYLPVPLNSKWLNPKKGKGRAGRGGAGKQRRQNAATKAMLAPAANAPKQNNRKQNGHRRGRWWGLGLGSSLATGTALALAGLPGFRHKKKLNNSELKAAQTAAEVIRLKHQLGKTGRGKNQVVQALREKASASRQLQNDLQRLKNEHESALNAVYAKRASNVAEAQASAHKLVQNQKVVDAHSRARQVQRLQSEHKAAMEAVHALRASNVAAAQTQAKTMVKNIQTRHAKQLVNLRRNKKKANEALRVAHAKRASNVAEAQALVRHVQNQRKINAESHARELQRLKNEHATVMEASTALKEAATLPKKIAAPPPAPPIPGASQQKPLQQKSLTGPPPPPPPRPGATQVAFKIPTSLTSYLPKGVVAPKLPARANPSSENILSETVPLSQLKEALNKHNPPFVQIAMALEKAVASKLYTKVNKLEPFFKRVSTILRGGKSLDPTANAKIQVGFSKKATKEDMLNRIAKNLYPGKPGHPKAPINWYFTTAKSRTSHGTGTLARTEAGRQYNALLNTLRTELKLPGSNRNTHNFVPYASPFSRFNITAIDELDKIARRYANDIQRKYTGNHGVLANLMDASRTLQRAFEVWGSVQHKNNSSGFTAALVNSQNKFENFAVSHPTFTQTTLHDFVKQLRPHVVVLRDFYTKLNKDQREKETHFKIAYQILSDTEGNLVKLKDVYNIVDDWNKFKTYIAEKGITQLPVPDVFGPTVPEQPQAYLQALHAHGLVSVPTIKY